MREPTEKLAKKPTVKSKKTNTQKFLPDRGEDVSTMELLLVSESSRHRARLNELVFELVSAATAFKTSLPDGMIEALSDLVRSTNCYFSNLIEGHNTHPVDIERALTEDYSADKEQRNLQLEAKAHNATQRWIDEGGRLAKRQLLPQSSRSIVPLKALQSGSGSSPATLDSSVRRRQWTRCPIDFIRDTTPRPRRGRHMVDCSRPGPGRGHLQAASCGSSTN